MPGRIGVPDTALAAVRRYCEDKIPPQHRHELRVDCVVRGRSITLFECRPPWRPELGPEWSRMPVAQLRYDPEDHHWRLYCAHRNRRWHPYSRLAPTPRLDELLTEIEQDPTAIFWG